MPATRRTLSCTTALLCAAFACSACRPQELAPRKDIIALAYLSAPHTAPSVTDDSLFSPDRRLFAKTERTSDTESRVTVTKTGSDSAVPIITIREADPGSGLSHQLAWTADSRALLILGSGSINGKRSGPICVVYRVAEQDLMAAPSCPAGT